MISNYDLGRGLTALIGFESVGNGYIEGLIREPLTRDVRRSLDKITLLSPHSISLLLIRLYVFMSLPCQLSQSSRQLRLQSNCGGAPHSKLWGMRGASAKLIEFKQIHLLKSFFFFRCSLRFNIIENYVR